MDLMDVFVILDIMIMDLMNVFVILNIKIMELLLAQAAIILAKNALSIYL